MKYLLLPIVWLHSLILIAQNDPISIASARIKAINTIVTVAGRVTVGNQFGNLVYIQDATGGIPLFGTGIANALEIGDSVLVKGPINTFNQQLQIGTSGQLFTKVNVPKKTLSPKLISLSELSAYEGQLVSIQNISFSEKGFVFTPNSNYVVSTGAVSGELRINTNTNLVGRTKPQTAFTASGVVGRFNNIYQLLPRFTEDLPGTLLYTVRVADRSKTFNVAAWNLNWFGNLSYGPTDEALQQANVKRTLDSLRADVFVLSEVANLPAFQQLIKQMNGYKGFCTSAVSMVGNLDDAQRVCFLYRTAVVDSISAKPLLKGAINLPNYPENNPQRFWATGRLPFLFVCDATINGIKKRLHLIGIHARANAGGSTATLAERELQYRQRRYDVEVLKDSLDTQYGNANVLLAGDYNDDVDETVSEITSTKESSYLKFASDTTNYQIVTKTLSETGFRTYLSFDNVIDHISISKALKTSYVKNSAGVELPFRYLANYTTTTSDHLPVVASFQFLPPITSVSEPTDGELIVFPNPNNGLLQWKSPDQVKEVNVYNLQGDLLFTHQTTENQLLDIQNLSTGLYIIALKTMKKKYSEN